MRKRIEITERQYDWLMTRCRAGKTLELVIWEVIDLVERIEADQKKYKAWIASTGGKNKAEKEKGNEDPGDAGEEEG